MFPSVYLTLISVLQAIALESLVDQQSVLDYSLDLGGAVLFLKSMLALHVTNNINRARQQYPGPTSRDVPLSRLRQPYLELAVTGAIALLVIMLIPQWSNDWVCGLALLALYCSLIRSTVAWLKWWKSASLDP